ncbi:MAG: rhomboid family intramembrane serine protease [Pseudonocardia sp.]|nr:rhomboid family intramembrane serine protease [Pseudonocardia sp.]
MTHPTGPLPPDAPAVCARHPDRTTGLSCTRCGRPACPDCLREASVGYQCVDCVAEGNQGVRQGVTVAGARPRTLARPIVTPVLVALNVLIFALTVLQSGSLGQNNASALFQAWVLQSGAVADGEWWRLVTAGFLHYGPLHLVFNMLALWIIGRDVETVLGRTRFLAVYLVSLLGGSAAVMLFSPNAAVAGASGAVFGLMGGLAVVLRRMRVPPGQAFGLIAVNIVISVVLPGISLAGHLGGLVVGAAATAALVYAPPRNRNLIQAGAIGGLAVLALLGIVLSL